MWFDIKNRQTLLKLETRFFSSLNSHSVAPQVASALIWTACEDSYRISFVCVWFDRENWESKFVVTFRKKKIQVLHMLRSSLRHQPCGCYGRWTIFFLTFHPLHPSAKINLWWKNFKFSWAPRARVSQHSISRTSISGNFFSLSLFLIIDHPLKCFTSPPISLNNDNCPRFEIEIIFAFLFRFMP